LKAASATGLWRVPLAGGEPLVLLQPPTSASSPGAQPIGSHLAWLEGSSTFTCPGNANQPLFPPWFLGAKKKKNNPFWGKSPGKEKGLFGKAPGSSIAGNCFRSGVCSLFSAAVVPSGDLGLVGHDRKAAVEPRTARPAPSN